MALLEPVFIPGDPQPRCHFCWGVGEAHHPDCSWPLVDQYRRLLPEQLEELKTAFVEELMRVQDIEEGFQERLALIAHVEEERR